MESNLIQVSGLSKSYGDHLVLDGLTFSLPEGEIVGLFGPNGCGKTTLFNQLTGSNQHVGNFPGVTVDQKIGAVKGVKYVSVVDLPGIYSIRPYSTEEIVTRDFILNEKPDGIINIVDATNIERNLYLTLQLMELGEPDASGRRRPVVKEGSEHTVDVDCVIMSIGTSPNPLIRNTTEGLETNKHGCIVTKDESGLTSREGVYAGGDAVTGAATVILAMGAGKSAAQAIDEYLLNK